MARKHRKPADIVAKLLQVEVVFCTGKVGVEGLALIEATEPTYDRWRSGYGGLKRHLSLVGLSACRTPLIGYHRVFSANRTARSSRVELAWPH